MPTSLAHYPSLDDRHYRFHARVAHYNALRLAPGFATLDWIERVKADSEFRIDEGTFVERERASVAKFAAGAPEEPDAFIQWFEALRDFGAGQGDALFPWLANKATLAQMRWFLTQEAAGEAGFDDLVAMAQVKAPTQAKLEMARNYWDEMGRGHERGMHGLMLADVVTELGLEPTVEESCWQSLALANLMVALAANRRYAWQAIGALGVIEMTAPGRVSLVNEGLQRLNVSTRARTYFQLHAGLDIKHSEAWNREILHSLVTADPRVAAPLAEGALMRLKAGARCFAAYREYLRV